MPNPKPTAAQMEKAREIVRAHYGANERLHGPEMIWWQDAIAAALAETGAVNAEKAQRWDDLRRKLIAPTYFDPEAEAPPWHFCLSCHMRWGGTSELHVPDCPLRPLESKDA